MLLGVALKPIWRTNVMIGILTNDFKKYNGLEDSYRLSFVCTPKRYTTAFDLQKCTRCTSF